MINIILYTKELKRNRQVFFIWLVVVALFTMIIMLFYPTLQDMGGAMTEMMKGLPVEMTRAFGMDPSVFQNILTYYALYYGMHIMVITGVFTTILSSGIIAKEEREGTADFLLTRPIWRTEIVATKVAVFFTYFLLFFIFQIGLATSGIYFILGETFDWNKFLVLNSYGLFLNICFAGIGFLISMLPKRGKSVTPTAIAIVVAAFVLNALSRISPDAEWLGYISPFYYADFEVIHFPYDFSWWRLLVLLGIGFGGIIATFLIFRRKDIYT